ncbi:MAG: cysteine desulfurase family protein [Gammaproteobacteria bacterium]
MPTYLDNNATTPLAAAARAAMEPFLADDFGNASSRHSYGRRARDAVEKARTQVAEAVGAKSGEVIFTASGTESNNTFIKGAAAFSLRASAAVGATEHPCVLCAARSLGRGGISYAPLAVDKNGALDIADLHQTLAANKDGAAAGCGLVSVMLANNETGVIQDIAKIAKIARQSGALFHTDAAQAVGKIPVSFAELGADAMTLSAHKAGGPKGAAALIIRGGVDFLPLMDGGGHEGGRRSGTENVAGIVGMGAAFAEAAANTDARAKKMRLLRDMMESQLCAAGAHIFAAAAPRLPNTSLFGFDGIDGETLVLMLDQSGFAVASGAACSSMKDDPSHVLLAMGETPQAARTAVRASLSADNTKEQITAFCDAARAIKARLQDLSAVC